MSNEINTSNFVKNIVVDDLNTGKHKEIITRFPPEPNGYLHIGHAKSICLNFGLADEFGGKTNLRFDDTNPVKEDTEYVESIKEDVKWLGFDWDNLYFASDYFDIMYEKAILLIKKGLAYVCDLTPEQMREYRGTLSEPGRPSPYRDSSVEENLDLLERVSFQMVLKFFVQKLIWHHQTSISVTLSFIVLHMLLTIIQVINGASTLCMTSLIH